MAVLFHYAEDMEGLWGGMGLGSRPGGQGSSLQ
jgi:hypothetical protein